MAIQAMMLQFYRIFEKLLLALVSSKKCFHRIILSALMPYQAQKHYLCFSHQLAPVAIIYWDQALLCQLQTLVSGHFLFL